MRIICQKSDLLNSINIAMRAVPTKTTLTILESFLIVADDDIRIITNDKDMGIETILNGMVEEKGKIAIDARIFGEIVRKLPDNNILLSVDENLKVRVKCEEAEFFLNGRNPEEFPELPATEEDHSISMSQLTLKELIRQTIFSIAVNEGNNMMKGELFEVEENKIKVVSLDSHRISIRKEELDGNYEHFKAIIPGKTLNEVSRILSGEKDDKVYISFDKNFVKFFFNSTTVISRLIDGEYFNVEQMISSDYETEIKINRNDLLVTMDRAFTLVREGERRPVILDIENDSLKADISTSLGSMHSEIPVKKAGKDVVIGFNSKYFIDALKVINDEEINIYFVNSTAPCFIKGKEGEYTYIILPININR